jgi:beta-lactamase regulating signal transducer with metallopeptidase domain
MPGYILSWLGRVTWETALLAAAVLVIQWAMGPRLSGRWRYSLWLLVLKRFALPFSVESSWSVFNFCAPRRATRVVYAA